VPGAGSSYMRLLVAALLLALPRRWCSADTASRPPLLLAAATGTAAAAGAAAARPHIVLALIDDWGHSDVGFTNRLVDDKLRTPRLDELSSGDGAVILRNYYVQHICTPTRSVLLSGRYQIHTGLQHATIHPAQPNSLPTDIPLVGDHLRALNYSTHMCGKWQ
jgi:arylsulfatase A-like enzyme